MGGRHKPRITVLCQYLYPEPGATSELISEILFGLAERGFSIDAIAGQPSYHGASKVPRVITQRGVEIRRVWSTQRSKDHPVGRVVNSLTFAASALLCVLSKPKGAVLLGLSNPPLLFWVCYLASKLRRHRYLLLVHDVYPEVAVELGVIRERGLIARAWKLLNRLAYRSAERVVVLGRDMKRVVETYVGASGRPPVSIIPNWADCTAITPRPREGHPLLKELGISNRFVVQYSGNIGSFHEIETILQAVRELGSLDFFFLFIGTGKEVSSVKNAAASATNIDLLPFQPRNNLAMTLTACDIALVTLKQGLGGLCVPSKLYGALAAGKPVVVLGPIECEAASVVTAARCGFLATPGEPETLVKALLRAKAEPVSLERMGRAARAVAEAEYDLPLALDRWDAMLSRTL